MKKISASILICTITLGSFGQKYFSNQTHTWLMYFGNHLFTEHWGIHTEFQIRRSDFMKNWQQSLIRVGVDYYTKGAGQFSAGYGWIETYPYGDQPVGHVFHEHRIWQQYITKNKAGRVDIQHRYRLEERFLENWVATNGNYSRNGYLFRERVRYRLLCNIPLSRRSLEDQTLFLSLYDEIFLGFGKGIGKNILDQNRLSFALGWRFNKNVNVQLGYLNQYLVKLDGSHIERNHTWQAALTYNLDFRKKTP